MKVAILGAGEYGTALGSLVAANGYDVDYYDPQKEPERLKDAVSGALAIILCVPSKVATRLLPHLPKETLLIVATKGFLSDKPFEKFKKIIVISGPGFAEDIKMGRRAFLTATDTNIAGFLNAENITFGLAEDPKGVLMCGALKNIYAILAGKFGLEPRTMAMRDFIEDASFEMGKILEANGADFNTIYQFCGIGDLTLTCSPRSRNYYFGQMLRRMPDYKPEGTVEGVTALKRICEGEIKIPKEAQYMLQMLEDCKKWA